MGGGGGAGTTNNGTGDNATYTAPPGLACSVTTGACSSGAPGGGIVILRANSFAGSGTITANGGDGYNMLNDSAGGGGAVAPLYSIPMLEVRQPRLSMAVMAATPGDLKPKAPFPVIAMVPAAAAAVVLSPIPPRA